MSIPPDDWARVRSVFEHALTVPESERSDYVAGVNGDRRARLDRLESLAASATLLMMEKPAPLRL